MHKYAAFNATKLRQLFVADATPLLRQRLATLEALGGHGNSLYAPVSAELVRVKDVERLLVFRNLQGCLELEEVLLLYKLSKRRHLTVFKLTFQGANCSNTMMRPLGSISLRFERPATTRSRAGIQALE